MSNIIYVGPFKDHIQHYIELKKAIGYKYDTDASHLKRFARFTLEKYPETTVLTKELVLDWCRKKTYEAQATQCSRASLIRQFGKYLESVGVNAYIIPKGYYPSATQ
jgi:integrase/recombinase XerD